MLQFCDSKATVEAIMKEIVAAKSNRRSLKATRTGISCHVSCNEVSKREVALCQCCGRLKGSHAKVVL